MKATLLVVADRGTLKFYDLGDGTEIPRLVGESHFEAARSRWEDRVTDDAGSFPSGVGGATAERMTAEAELETRAFRQIAGRIVQYLDASPAAQWAFAAPSEINSAIVDGLPSGIKGRLVRNLSLDLTNVPAGQLWKHLSAS